MIVLVTLWLLLNLVYVKTYRLLPGSSILWLITLSHLIRFCILYLLVLIILTRQLRSVSVLVKIIILYLLPIVLLWLIFLIFFHCTSLVILSLWCFLIIVWLNLLSQMLIHLRIWSKILGEWMSDLRFKVRILIMRVKMVIVLLLRGIILWVLLLELMGCDLLRDRWLSINLLVLNQWILLILESISLRNDLLLITYLHWVEWVFFCLKCGF